MNPPLPTVLAALRRPPAAGPVLDTALRFAEMAKGHVEAVHVGEGPAASLDAMVRRAGVPLLQLTGQSAPTLLDALDTPAVLAITMGAGTTPADGYPVSTTTLHVIEQARKPVLVVPTEVEPSRPLRRLLMPLEGTASTSKPVLDALRPLLSPDVEIIVVHVFTDATRPRMLDRPRRDLELLGREFLAQHCPPATAIELRSGPVATTVSAASREHEADLVVLSWLQDSSSGRARVVREVLRACGLPVLLVPTARAAGPKPTVAAADVPPVTEVT